MLHLLIQLTTIIIHLYREEGKKELKRIILDAPNRKVNLIISFTRIVLISTPLSRGFHFSYLIRK